MPIPSSIQSENASIFENGSLLDDLLFYVYAGKNCKDTILIDQLSSLTVRNGRIDHASGKHDDMVVAWLLAYWFLQTAENKNFYGFAETEILSKIDNSDSDQTPREKHNRKVQNSVIDTINKLIERLKTETNKFYIRGITLKILHLHKSVSKSNDSLFNLKSVLNKIKSVDNKNYIYRRDK